MQIFTPKVTHLAISCTKKWKIKILKKSYPQACRKMWISIISASYPQFNRMRGFFMQREKFSSRLGFILISAGCAIGLGNVWRFPYIEENMVEQHLFLFTLHFY